MGHNSMSRRGWLTGALAAVLIASSVPAATVARAVADDNEAFSCVATASEITWTSTSATNYYVRRDLGDGSSYVGSSTSLSFATDGRYGTFSVISYADGRRVATCEGPGGPITPSHTCSVEGAMLSWTDQGADRYFVRREVDGVDAYLGTTQALSYPVDPAGIYTVVTWNRGVKFSTRCAGILVDRQGPELVWNTNNTKSPFSMNLLRGTSDPRGDVLSVLNINVVSGSDHFVTASGNRLSVDPGQVTASESVEFSYDVVGEPGVVYRSSATINVAFINNLPSDSTEIYFADAHAVLEQRTGLHTTIEGSGGFNFGGFGGVAVARAGRIYAVDTRNHRIQICDIDGSCSTFGGFGDRPGKFYFPAGIAVDDQRNVWIGDTGNRRLQKCSRNGTSCVVVPFDVAATGSPSIDVGPVYAIAFAGSDHIVFSNNTDLVRCDLNGNACDVIELSNTGPDDVITQIAVQPDGRTFIGTAAGTLGTCRDILDQDDAECVGNSTPTHALPGEPIDALAGVAAESSGRLVVSDVVNHRLLACDSHGVRCDVIAGTEAGLLTNPHGLAVDSNGLIYVVDLDADAIQVVARRGVLVNASDIDDDALVVSAVEGRPAAVGVATLTGLGALVTIDADGGVTYDPTQAAALQALGLGQSIEDVISYTVSDGRGGATTSQMTVRVTGRRSN